MGHLFNFEISEVELLLTLSRRVRDLSNEDRFIQPSELALLARGFDLLNLEKRISLWHDVDGHVDSAGK